MAPVVAYIGSAVAAWAADITIGSILASIATSVVLSGLQRLLLSGKGSGSSIQNSGITTQVRQAIIVRKPTYGEMRRSGGVLFLGMTDNNKYLHMIVEVAPHEIQEIGEVWLNDYSIPSDWLDDNGNVTEGRYKNLVRIRKYLGSAGQSADSYLVTEVPEWTSNNKLSGIAYIYVRMKWDQDKFPTGVPNLSAWIKGKKIYDPRTTLTKYSNNPALIINDYLQWDKFGLGADSTEIDENYTIAAANSCDEFITVTNYDTVVSGVSSNKITLDGDRLYYQTGDKIRFLTTGTLPSGLAVDTDYYVICYQRKDTPRILVASTYANALAGVFITISDAGTGTHTVRKIAEPRYSGAITIDTEVNISENIKDILSGMAGFLTYSGGVYRIVSGIYQTPTVYFNEANIVSAVSVQTKVSKRERYNTVSGTYTSPINDGQPSDYPQVTNSMYVDQDLETIVKQIDMPVTQRAHTSQRIAKINLELSRQEITWSADFDLTAMQVAAGENAFFSFDRFGWSNKVFQVKNWRLEFRSQNDSVIPVVNMTLREIAAECYDWNNGEETRVDPAPNSLFPDVYTVQAVTGLGVSSEAVETQGGDTVFKVLMQWDVSPDEFVYNGGFYEIQYKRSSELNFRPTYTVPGDFDFAEVTLAAQLNEDYDIRIRAVNNLGVRSSYTSLLGYLVGTSGGVGETEDWGLYSESPSTNEDWGTYSESPSTTEDWGYYT